MSVYLKTRFTRTAIWTSMVLLMTVLDWFVCFYSGLIVLKEAEREDAYNLPVELVITDLRGTSTDSLGVRSVELWTMVRDKEEKAAQWHFPTDLSRYFSEIRIKTSLYYKGLNGTNERFVGITALGAAPEINKSSGTIITYFKNTEHSFEDSGSIELIVPESYLENLEKDEEGEYPPITLTVGLDKDLFRSIDITTKITGYYSGLSSENIYCSWNYAASIIEQFGGFSYADSISATVADNTKLDELREDLKIFYTDPDPTGTQKKNPHAVTTYYYPNAVIIHDELMSKTIQSLNRNIFLLKKLFPLIAIFEYLISAGAAFYYINLRKHEIAIMRSLGVARTTVLSLTFAEMLIICVAAFVLSVILSLIIPICIIKVPAMIPVGLFGLVGAIISAFKLSEINGVRILKEEHQ